jgi:hypothetical protein
MRNNISGTTGTMPSPTGGAGSIWGPIISGGLQIGSDYLSNKQRQKLEADARKFNREMWELQNKYNHPLQQMARLKEAGLNPNLIYGSSPGSAVGNAGAVAPGKAPEYNMRNPMNAFMNAKVQQAQSNNLKSVTDLNTLKGLTEIQKAGLSRAQKELLQGTLMSNIEIAENQASLGAQQVLQEKLKTKALSNKQTGLIARYAAETQKAMAEKDIAKLRINVEQLNSELASYGIRPTDPYWYRAIGLGLGWASDKIQGATQAIQKEFNRITNNKN